MSQESRQKAGGVRWYHVVGLIVLLMVAGIVIQLFVHYPSIAEVYRPTKFGIERVERREVRRGKGTVILDFYYGKYSAYDMQFSTSFATEPGIYTVGDTVFVLYNPEKPVNNLIYAPESGAVHLTEGSNLQGVEISYDDVVRLFDSIEGAGGL